MPWVKLDDQFPVHPKVDALSDGAFRLHVSAMCWSAQFLTDGYIPAERLRRLVPRFKASYITELTTVLPGEDNPAWLPLEDGYQIHEFTDYQKSREWWKEKRAGDAKRIAKWREEQALKQHE